MRIRLSSASRALGQDPETLEQREAEWYSGGMKKPLLLSFLVLFAVACGDDDVSSADGGGLPDASTDNARELAGDLRQAEFDLAAGLCDCRFERDGYDSAAACVADLDAVTPAVRRCAVDSVVPYLDEVQASITCSLEMNLEYIACNEAATCADSDARTACFDAAEAARLGCFLSDRGLSWLDDELSCLTDEFVGPAEGACPDVTASGLGEIATFDTTLRGNDTTGSCGFLDQADVSVEWTAPTAGDYEFRAESSADVFLYALDSCGGTEVACDTEPTLIVTLGAGESIILVVDGYTPRDVGNVVLSVSAAL